MNVTYRKGKKRTRRFSREKSGSFNNHENVPKMALFWLCSDFDGNLAQRCLLLKVSYENSDFPWNPRENRMSGKNLVDFWEFFSGDAYTRSGLFEWSVWFSVIFSSLDDRINLKLHILTELNGAHDLVSKSLLLDHSKIKKCLFEWSK